MRGGYRATYGAVALTALLAIWGSTGSARAQPTLARIAFTSSGRVFTIAADGSDRLLLAGGVKPRSGSSQYFEPAWSPDATRLALVRSFGIGRGDSRSQIYLMDSVGGDRHPLTPADDRVFDIDPEWSPDGEWIAFTRYVDTDSGSVSKIVAIRSDGSEKRTIASERLTPRSRSLAFLGEPAWSPDGSTIAFTRTVLDTHSYYFKPSLYLVNADGTNKRLLKKNASGAAWAPDGSRIAFVSTRDRNGEDCNDECSYRGEIYVMDADGASLVRLTRNKGRDYGPDWSADGERIAFASDRNYPYGRSPELYSIAPDGSCLTWLTNGSPGSATPDWRPDAGASTDPGGCGATARSPLVELDASGALGIDKYPVYWLGQTFRSMLLDYVLTLSRLAYFDYEDCGRYRASDCGPGVQVQDRWICSPTLLSQAGAARRLVKRHGALLAYFGPYGGLTAYTGRAEVKVYLDGRSLSFRDHLAVVRGLRKAEEAAPPDELPPPVVPRHLLRQLRKTERVYRRLGSIAAASDELGISETTVRSRLRLARALHRFGSIHTVRCPRRARSVGVNRRSGQRQSPGVRGDAPSPGVADEFRAGGLQQIAAVG